VDQDQVLVLHQDLVLELQAIRTRIHTTRTTTITTLLKFAKKLVFKIKMN
jgi:hypothetical protein